MKARFLAAALPLAAPQAMLAQEAGACEIAVAADPDSRKALAAAVFSKADEARIDDLIACLGDPDPVRRDEGAFALWSEGLRGKLLSPEPMRHAMQRLSAPLAAPDDAVGFRKPVAALALSEVARADRIAAFLTDAECHALAQLSATYMRGIADHSGFVAGEGWRHGVAHGADLMLQLALNPRLARADVDPMLAALGVQIAPVDHHHYHQGEAGRLGRPILFLAKRTDIDDAARAAWFRTLHPDAALRWQAPDGSDEKLAAAHNSTAFAQAIYVAASESQDPQVRRLAPLALGLIEALP
ncbi:MAG: DUF2785 domain-containing protein [Sphingopyxis sp.]|nr:DUF2785 domain-containing protein [Sphingopyxis sp.]